MNKNEFPIEIIIDSGEDAYEKVFDAISKYFYDENGCMIVTDYYVTLEMVYGGYVSWITTCLEYDDDLCDFVWNTDWWEGECDIVIHGVAIDTFDYMCDATQKRRIKPMNNAEWLCETTERFNRFFNHLANGRFDDLEKEFGFKAEVDIKKEFNDWLLLEHKEV